MIVTHEDFRKDMQNAMDNFQAAKDAPNDGRTKKLIIDKMRKEILTIIGTFLTSDERPVATA